MDHEDSVSEWMDALKRQDDRAAEKLWERYFHRLAGLARKQLGGAAQGRDYDEEDIALSVFDDVFRAIQQEKFPELQNRNELWSLLAMTTIRKARLRLRRDHTQKRSVLATISESEMEEGGGMDALSHPQTAPDMQALMAEQCRMLLGRLGDDQLEQIAIWKLDRYTNDEIAERLGRTRRSVQRMLNLIRDIWREEA